MRCCSVQLIVIKGQEEAVIIPMLAFRIGHDIVHLPFGIEIEVIPGVQVLVCAFDGVELSLVRFFRGQDAALVFFGFGQVGHRSPGLGPKVQQKRKKTYAK